MEAKNKKINVAGLTMIAIGACIGSGIFVSPSQSFSELPHHGFVLATWLIGGIISCFGALTFSELGARFPGTGGVYIYLKEAYGDITGFLYGWITLLIVNTGALAALTITLADYSIPLLNLPESYKIPFAIVILWILTIINIFGIKASEWFSNIFTSLKLSAIFAIIAAGIFYFYTEQPSHDIILFDKMPSSPLQGMLVAFIGVFWSMGGWHHASYLAAETDNPTKTVPKAMIFGTMTVTLVYILVIFSYILVLDIPSIQSSTKIAADTMGKIWSYGSFFVSIAIVISITGTIGIYTMTAPRIYYAMAKDKLFFPFLAELSPRYGTPYKAMIFQSVWASVLIFAWGSFIKVITFVTFMDIVFMALTAISIFIFRQKKSATTPIFKVPFYPYIPVFYTVVTTAFVFYTASGLGIESLSGLGILVAGIPVYFIFKRNKKVFDQ
jgi:APA family basic amino acid/polyamine antiporter